MQVPGGLRAREPVAAARAAATLTGFSGVVLLPWALFLPPLLAPAQMAACVAVALLLFGLTWGLARGDAERLDRAGATFAVPVFGCAVVAATNVLTGDVSASAQIFLIVPLLLGATQLRRLGALLTAVFGVLASGAATVAMNPTSQGFTDAVVVGSAMLAVAVVLARAADRRDEAFAVLHEQASSDGLTGLLRRRALDTALGTALGRGQVALLMVDVDGFKQINDAHGHLVGDDALVHLADVLRSQVRHDDCVVGRLGGDELVMVLPGCAREGVAARAADLVAAVRAAPLALAGGARLALTISVGAAHAPSDAGDLSALYAAADAALYRAKRAGRDRFAVAA
ncbi:diguanylate cyclase (GGDEF) domain-containing protein [Klenkia marina]|uniref:Diguanylate cyclase (GGDEF) domain-containing protein n=1 Tax=Klenkia marina TaxID=1960309 RepID=A0A1G4XH14_9ACTN|nr:GGDEF domain-containing protein [Klenkia marina]SCX40417.1 diguanylate cyclase (GGDEF) domain-containing protein [Klenkia marina]